ESDEPAKRNRRHAKPLNVRVRANHRREEHVQRHQNRERSDVENAFHGPYSQLRGERQVLAARDQIGPDEFSRPPQQRQTGESDKGGRNQAGSAGVAHGFEEELPAQGSQDVGKVYESNRGGHMQRLHAAGAAEAHPVETPPVLHLEIDQQPQDCHDRCGGQDACFAHSAVELPVWLQSNLYETARWINEAGVFSARRSPTPSKQMWLRSWTPAQPQGHLGWARAWPGSLPPSRNLL